MGKRCVTKDWMGKWRLIGLEGDEARRLGWKRDELGRIDGKEITIRVQNGCRAQNFLLQIPKISPLFGLLLQYIFSLPVIYFSSSLESFPNLARKF